MMRGRLSAVKIGVTLAAACLTPGCDKASDPGTPASRDTIALPGTRVFPESIAAASDGTLYVGSAGHGSIYRVPPGGAAQIWLDSEKSGTRSVFGLVVDESGNALWACTNAPIEGDGPGAALRRYALGSGAQTGHWPITGETPICNDIALADDGSVFLTDTLAGRVLRLPPDGTALEPWFEDKDALFGVDGIAFESSGRMLLTNVIGNSLLALEVVDGRPGVLVTLEPSMPLGRPDSLRPLGEDRFVMTENEAGRVTQVRFTGTQAQMNMLSDGDVGVSGAVPGGGALWTVNAMLQYTREPELKGKDPGPASIRRLPLPD